MEYNGAIISRDNARVAKLKRFFTGEPCKYGHLAQRLVSSGGCVTCNALQSARWKSENPEKAKALQDEYTSRNADAHRARSRRWRADNLEASNKRAKDWVEANKARHLENARRYYRDNKERIKVVQRNWRKLNQETVKAHRWARKALKRKADGSHSGSDIKCIFRAQKGRCAYCRVQLGKNYHIDHIMPLARGGSNYPNNIQLLCPRCNTAKHANHPADYARRIGLLI